MTNSSEHDHESSGDHFDDRAATWDENPEHVTRAAAIARAIIAAVPVARSMRMLEYGAGTGLVSQALGEQVGPLTLADTSPGMRAVIRSKLDAGLLPGARVWDADLAAAPPPPSEQFDLIVTVMTLHHIEASPRCSPGSRRCSPRAGACASPTSNKKTARSTVKGSTATMASPAPP